MNYQYVMAFEEVRKLGVLPENTLDHNAALVLLRPWHHEHSCQSACMVPKPAIIFLDIPAVAIQIET